MLATKWRSVFADPLWAYEMKWDGVRAILSWDGSAVQLRSRRGLDASARYPELVRFQTDRPVILDGEIVALDEAGRPSFGRLQGRMNLANASQITEAVTSIPITYVVFDLLYWEEPMIGQPWSERRERLEGLDLRPPLVLSDVFHADPTGVWDFVQERHLEGIVAKKADSIYRPGHRSSEWRKIANVQTAKGIVCGYTRGDGGRANSFGALVLGINDGPKKRYIGAVGTGFDDKSLVAIRAALDEMRVDGPVLEDPELPQDVAWVEPRLVAAIELKEWTTSGRMRAPVFKGFTEDNPETVHYSDEGP